MRYFLSSAQVLAMDFASTILFLVAWQLTRSTAAAAALGLALGIGQVSWKLYRREAVDALQWISLVLVMMSSTAAVITGSPRFVMVKPSVVYVVIGAVMLKRGWMMRYVPRIVRDTAPDLVAAWGYAWAALMFLSAGLNAVLALRLDVPAWAISMSVWGIGSKSALLVVQFFFIRAAMIRRLRGAPPVAAVAA